MSAPTAAILAESVLPVFVPDERHGEIPDRAGTCVLVRLNSRHFVVTAKHNFGDFTKQQFFVGRPRLGQVIPFHVGGIYTVNDLDVAVIPLNDEHLALLGGLAFIPEPYIEREHDRQPPSDDEFIVFGFPDSNSQFRVNRPTRKIDQNSFLLPNRSGGSRGRRTRAH